MKRSARLGCLAACILVLLSTSSQAQSPPSRAAPPKPLALKQTTVEFEVMLAQDGDPVAPQQWGPIFERLGAAVRFRQRIEGDEVSVTENTRGSYRTVTAIGELGRDDTLRFPGKSFTMDNTAALKTWITELQTYGAQGSPDGQPIWGLTDQQFDALFSDLSQPVAPEVEGLEFQPALKQLGLPGKYPFRLHETARELFQSSDRDHPLRYEVQGLSGGTALAIVLADYGLGFRPLRTPSGLIELVAEPLDKLAKPWPIGWPVDPDRPRNETAPKLFEQVSAGFDNLPLADVLSAVEQASETRVIVDYERCARRNIDPAEKTVSYPKKQTAWILILRTVTSQARLSREIMIDEAGTAFVYVFPFEPKKPADAKGRGRL